MKKYGISFLFISLFCTFTIVPNSFGNTLFALYHFFVLSSHSLSTSKLITHRTHLAPNNATGASITHKATLPTALKQNIDQFNKLITLSSSLTLYLTQDPLVESRHTAIVNAANKDLQGGGGICGAIFQKAGWQKLQSLCNAFNVTSQGRCPTGQAVITDSCAFKNNNGPSYIIHAVGPIYKETEDLNQQIKLLIKTYYSALEIAEQHNISSIAFPLISSNIYGFPLDKAVAAALYAFKQFNEENPDTLIKDISLHFFKEEEKAALTHYVIDTQGAHALNITEIEKNLF